MEHDTSFGTNRQRQTWALSGTLVTGDTSKSISLQTGDLTTLGYSYFTVSFSVIPPATDPADAGFSATATITFLVNGVPITRQVSIGQGVEVSGPADAITVRVIDVTPCPGWATAGNSYTVSVAVVAGTRAATTENQPILYSAQSPAQLNQANVAPFDIQFPVPSGAGVTGFWLSAQASATPPTNALLLVSQLNGATLIDFTYNQVNPLWVPLAPGANIVDVENSDHTNAVILTLMWTIDG